jgi:hypothetical protein
VANQRLEALHGRCPGVDAKEVGRGAPVSPQAIKHPSITFEREDAVTYDQLPVFRAGDEFDV